MSTTTDASTWPKSASPSAPWINDDWLSVWIGLLIFFSALAWLYGYDLLGWAVSTSVWIDPQLDLTVVPPLTALNTVPLLWHLFRGTLDRVPKVFRLRAAEFIVERAAPGPIHTDGEVHQAPARVVFAIRPSIRAVQTPC